jgi:hypothetical protein
VAPRAGLEPATLRLTVASRRFDLSSYRATFINRFKHLDRIRPRNGVVPDDSNLHRRWVQFWVQKSLVVTTNLPFKQWDSVFPNAACAVALIDRLTHHAEIITIEGESYRKREAEQSQKAKQAQKPPPSPKPKA